MFTGTQSTSQTDAGQTRPDAEGVFTDVFEEASNHLSPDKSSLKRQNLSQLLRPEVERRVPWWSYVGAVSGGGLGFIVANLPGLMLGAVAGNRLGAIRDAKGKSVAAVFNDLGGQQKAEVSFHLHA